MTPPGTSHARVLGRRPVAAYLLRPGIKTPPYRPQWPATADPQPTSRRDLSYYEAPILQSNTPV